MNGSHTGIWNYYTKVNNAPMFILNGIGGGSNYCGLGMNPWGARTPGGTGYGATNACGVYGQDDAAAGAHIVMFSSTVNGTAAFEVFRATARTDYGTYAMGGRCFANQLYLSGGAVTGSDIRLKKDVTSIEVDHAFKLIDMAQPVTYRLKADDTKVHAGLIAQDFKNAVQSVYGDNYKENALVDYPNEDIDMENFYSINYQEIIPYLMLAIKSLKQEIDALKSQ
jgi:hypothetical protein